MASRQEILIHLRTALDNQGIKATREQVSAMAREMQRATEKANKSMINGWTDVWHAGRTALLAIKGAWGALRTALSSAFRFETIERQFKTLIGSIDDAKKHMQDLKELGDTPPFSIEQFAAASRSMMVMSEGVLGYKESLVLVGDAAAATGTDIQTMGHAVGRLYALIRDGQPIGRAALELRNIGVLTPEVVEKLDRMQKAGASNVEMWNIVTESLSRYGGAMAEAEQTGEGLAAAISTRWDNIVRSFGEAFSDLAKDGMGQVLETMKRLEEDDTIYEWARTAAEVVEQLASAMQSVAKPFVWMWEAAGKLDAWTGDAIEKIFGTEVYFSTRGRAQQQQVIESEKAQRREARAKNAARKSRVQRDEQQGIVEALVAGDIKIAERNAEKVAKTAADAEIKEQKRVHAERMKMLSDYQRKQQVASDRFEKELAMYRDSSLRDKTYDEENGRRDALDKLKKEVAKYNLEDSVSSLAQILRTQGETAFDEEVMKRRKSWGYDNLGSRAFGFRDREMEQIVRTAAAQEAKSQSERDIANIEKSTREIADKIESLMAMKGGE